MNLFTVHLIFTAIMVGVIWLVQVVHYPSFNFIDKKFYSDFQNFHIKRISFIVIPVMLLELVSGLILIFLDNRHSTPSLISFGILILIWIITGLFFAKAHQDLTVGYDREIVKKIIKLNWIRTLLWSIRLILLLF
tara:strand:- start:236 stop:640 length:405 start_codon:yes stop_codon:yes gene_type:complete